MKATKLFPVAGRMLAASALLAMVGLIGGCPSPPSRPDVVLVTIDTLRADHCSAYGYPVETTPQLDALASRGLLFRRAYAESSTTAPSHAVLLTGRHFRTLGVRRNGHAIPPDALTLAEALAEEGYATAAFISSFPLLSRFGFSQGFELYYDKLVMDEASLGRRKPGSEPHDRLAGATLAHVQNWFEKRSDDRPLFLWVHFVDPHAPYRAPEKFQARWPEGTKPGVQRYDAEVRYADRQLGRLLELVARHTPDREDLVVVTSDHGEGLGDHGVGAHGVNLHEEAVRVPLVASWPGHLQAGRVVEEPVALVDVARGILGLVGVEADGFAHGRDLFGALDPDRPIFLQRRDYRSGQVKGHRVSGPMNAVVQGDSKLIVAPDEARRELYDLQADPGELDDLLSTRASPEEGGPAAGGAGRKAVPQAAKDAAGALEGTLGQWQQAFPSDESDQPLDKETIKALRSLGYVD